MATVINTTRAADTQAALSPGYEAQGFALAQTMIGGIKSYAMDLKRCVQTAFTLDAKAREYAAKGLKEFVKAAKEAAASTKPHEGIDAKSWGKIANTATVRASQFNTILKAMNAGMNLGVVGNMLHIQDPESCSFDTIYKVAKDYNESSASGKGRPADSFQTRLAKWLAKQEDDTGMKEQAVAILKSASILEA